MRDFEQKLKASLATFVDDIERLVRQRALGALAELLGARAAAPIGHALAPARAARSTGRVGRVGRERARGRKRSPDQLARLTRTLDGYIRKHKGLGIEAIAKELGASTKELALPIKRLLAERRIAARGVKRATRYFPK